MKKEEYEATFLDQSELSLMLEFNGNDGLILKQGALDNLSYWLLDKPKLKSSLSKGFLVANLGANANSV